MFSNLFKPLLFNICSVWLLNCCVFTGCVAKKIQILLSKRDNTLHNFIAFHLSTDIFVFENCMLYVRVHVWDTNPAATGDTLQKPQQEMFIFSTLINLSVPITFDLKENHINLQLIFSERYCISISVYVCSIANPVQLRPSHWRVFCFIWFLVS